MYKQFHQIGCIPFLSQWLEIWEVLGSANDVEMRIYEKTERFLEDIYSKCLRSVTS